ncbi:MAG TPA: hypothetical protein VGQ93_15020 [Lysobacter sp.]|jgi:hypothetical protein|nr:hypothetical protein [Lysobacter sp.]
MGFASGLLALVLSTAGATVVAPPAACTGDEYRQFDFWLGEWDVYGGVDGARLVGHNRIERSGNGCWLSEHWHSARGSDGTSVNAWDAQSQVWRQFWVGGDGVVLRLEGGLHDGVMVMTGALPKAGGGVQRQKVSWTPKPDGSVVQHWEISDDDGKSWTTSFLGSYRRKTAAAPHWE